MKSLYFAKQILPGFNFKRIHATPTPLEQLDNNKDLVVSDQNDLPPPPNFPQNKKFLVILDIENRLDQAPTGISEQSLILQKKIISSMKIQDDIVFYIQKINQSYSTELLMDQLEIQTDGALNVIFLIGASVTQHFLGHDKKISQVQGKIFEYNHQKTKYYFIPLYHPDFISLNSSIKSLTWESVKFLQHWIKEQQLLSH